MSLNQWNKIYQIQGAKYSSRLKYWPSLIKFFRQNNVNRVLDVGCGAGKHLLYLARRGFEVYGVDKSEEGITLARQTFTDYGLPADFKVHSLPRSLPYPKNYFDAVISLRTLNHGTIGQIKKSVNEIKTVIRPGGYIFVTSLMISGRKRQWGATTLNSLPVKMIKPRTYIPLVGKETGIIHYLFNKKILLGLFKDFQIIKFWVEYGQKKWERYYCLLGQKR